MNFTSEQAAAITQDGNLVVTAGAGSGKTRVLVERYLRLLTERVQQDLATATPDASDILAITFTEKAAREMRDRVRDAVEAGARAAPLAARPLWEHCRAAIESARIGTIHSFCAALLRAQPIETGIDPGFVVLDEVEAGLLLAEGVDAALGSAVRTALAQPATPTSNIAGLLDEFGLEELRGILTGMLLSGGEVRGALADFPDTSAALQARWRERLAAAQATAHAEVLHDPAWREAETTIRQLATVASDNDLIGKQVLAIAAQLDAVTDATAPPPVFALVSSIKLNGGSKKNWPSAADLAAAKEALRTLRETYQRHAAILNLVFEDELEERAAQATLGLGELYQQAVAQYTKRKTQQNALDYDDLEHRARVLLETHPFVRTRWRAELQAVLVDEFQDTNAEQRTIIYALTGIDEQPAQTNLPELFVVGDAKQSIYRFRGADVSVFQAVQQDLLAHGGRGVALDTSFRTHPYLLTWLNQTIQPIFARPRALHPYETPFEVLRPYRPDPDHAQCIELHITSAEASIDQVRAAEAHALAERLRALVAGAAEPIVYDAATGWRVPTFADFALLFQASTVFEQYEQALREAGIPFLTTAGRGYFGRKEVQDLINLLRVLNDPSDELALVGVLRSPLFALDDQSILRLRFANRHSLWHALQQTEIEQQDQAMADVCAFARETLRDLHTLRGRVTVVELLRAALAATGYLATISGLREGERRRANVEKLIEAARRAGSSGLSTFSAYLDTLLRVEAREGEAPLEADGSVRLMTVHRSKGLEFPIVVLPDLGRRAMPRSDTWLARRAYGLALRLRSNTGDWQQSVAYELAQIEEQRMEQAERERLLYVALTRARDYLILSGPAATKSGETWLSRIVAALGWPWEQGGPTPGTYDSLRVWRHET